MTTASAKALTDDRRPLAWQLITLLVVIVGTSVAQGKDLNWDQTNYHIYIAHAWLNARLEQDFFAASIQSYLLPIAHLPFYWVATSDWHTALGTAILASIHACNVLIVHAVTWQLLGKHEHRSLIATSLSLMNAFAPIMVAETGSSLSELIASIPMTAGFACLVYATTQTKLSPLKLLGAYGLIGCGAALKLPFVVFAAPAIFFAPGASNDRPFRATFIALLGVSTGALLVGGWHHWQIWEIFSNPFFPFFNKWWGSPYFATENLANDRYLRINPTEWLTLPAEMLAPRNHITAETTNVDFRPIIALIASMIALPNLIKIKKNSNANSAPNNNLMLSMIAFYWASHILWCMTSGNARYAIPLHLMTPFLVATCLCQAPFRETLKTSAIIVAVAASIITTASTWSEIHWNRAPHTPRWYEHEVPKKAINPNAIYLSVGYFDRSSHSYLIRYLPEDSTYITINGYANLNIHTQAGKRAAEIINKAPLRALMLIAEPPAKGMESTWLVNINENLNQFGTELETDKACAPIKDTSTQQMLAMACPLKRTKPTISAAYAKVDHYFDELEAENPDHLKPRTDASYHRNAEYCRFYSATEIYVCSKNGAIYWMQISPQHKVNLCSIPRGTCNEAMKIKIER